MLLYALFGVLHAKGTKTIAAEIGSRGPFYFSQFNFYPSMDNQSHVQQRLEWNYLSILKLQQFGNGLVISSHTL